MLWKGLWWTALNFKHPQFQTIYSIYAYVAIPFLGRILRCVSLLPNIFRARSFGLILLPCTLGWQTAK